MAKFDVFDREIQSKLEQFDVGAKPDWAFMQRRLSQVEEDLLFDQKIKSILQDVQVNSKEIEWTEFQAKLKRHTERRQKIITTRAIESLLLLLLLWTLNNIGLTHIIPYEKGMRKIEVFAQAHGEKNMGQFPSVASTDQTSLKPISRQPDITEGTETSLDKPSGLSKTPEFRTTDLLSQATINENVESSATGFSKYQTTAKVYAAAALQPENNSDLSASLPSLMQDQILPDLALTHNTIDVGLLKTALQHADELKLPAEITLLPKDDALEFNLNVQHGIHPSTTQQHITRWIGLSAGFMINYITSPSFVQNSGHFHQVQLGHSLGLFVGSQFAEWMVESGISYQSIHYQPNMSETLGSFETGYYKIRFHKLQSHIVNIPVLLHRVLYAKNNWSISAKAGLSISASLHNEFSVDTLTNLNGKATQGISFDPSQPSEIASRVRLQANQGILQGGSVGVNSYANLVGGIRYDRDLNPKMRFFTELELGKMLGSLGFGPNSDNFFTSTLKAGVSFRL